MWQLQECKGRQAGLHVLCPIVFESFGRHWHTASGSAAQACTKTQSSAAGRDWQKSRNDAAPGIVLVQFEKKEHKLTVFKARGKLAGTKIGIDDDLTRLQQERKNAAWPAFKEYRANGVKTQWRAEKLYVKEGEHFVEHKVLNL